MLCQFDRVKQFAIVVYGRAYLRNDGLNAITVSCADRLLKELTLELVLVNESAHFKCHELRYFLYYLLIERSTGVKILLKFTEIAATKIFVPG